MKIRDLPLPVTAAKADWLPATTWVGFTPSGKGHDAAAKCQSTVKRQFGNGYVLERVTDSFEEPNEAFADDPHVAEDRERHNIHKGCLISVHRLRATSRPLSEIIGSKEFEILQDIWASGGNRRRWSVAFPIIESYRILDTPSAKAVFGSGLFKHIFGYQCAILRPLNGEAQERLADLTIEHVPAFNSWTAIEDEIKIAERLPPSAESLRSITIDLNAALEGESVERRQRLLIRAAWLGDRFVSERRKLGVLSCDECGFDPTTLTDMEGVSPRSCLDVHHKHPLYEGKRYTTTADFALLCPTCHRVTHRRLERKTGPTYDRNIIEG